MQELFLTYEPAIRLSFFAGMLVTMAVLEAIWPRRLRTVSRWLRWPNNLGITLLNTGLARLLFPASAVAFALLLESQGVGLLTWAGMPAPVNIILGIVLLDLAIYLQHVVLHAVPVLWRLHRMHHADLDFDVTTGSRFHPVEIALSMLFKLMVVAVLGVPAVAVLIFEILLNATSMFNHSNLAIPVAVDRMLRLLLVTPDMHRVHHSVIMKETNSNYGFNLPWWDRLFGTYRDQPALGHEVMQIGLEQFREPRELWLDRLLTQPLRNPGLGWPALDWIDVNALSASLSKADAPMIVDVRGPDEFSGALGHISGAINLPLGALLAEPQALESYKDHPLTLVCKTDQRSAKAAKQLGEAGFCHVTILRGGMEQWNLAGFPVEMTPPRQS